MRNKLTTYYKDKAGQEIIETQTYYTQPEKDWEFDEDQLLTYNNPVFVEQCKIRGKDFEALNTGWVKQRKIGEPEEEMDEPEDLDEEDDDLSEEDESKLFDDDDDDFDDIDDDDDDDDIKPPTKSDSNKPESPKPDNKPPTPEKPDISQEELAALFGGEPVKPAVNIEPPVTSGSTETPTASVASAKPKLKLNIKPPAQPTQPISPAPPTKPGNIKLNIKNKPKT